MSGKVFAATLFGDVDGGERFDDCIFGRDRGVADKAFKFINIRSLMVVYQYLRQVHKASRLARLHDELHRQRDGTSP